MPELLTAKIPTNAPIYGVKFDPKYLHPCADCGGQGTWDLRREHGADLRCSACSDRFLEAALNHQGRSLLTAQRPGVQL